MPRTLTHYLSCTYIYTHLTHTMHKPLITHTTQTNLTRSTPWQPYGARIHTTSRQINTPGTPSSSCCSFAVISALMLTLALIPQIPVLCTRAVKWGQGAIQCDNYCERSEHAGWYHVSCISSFIQLYAELVNSSLPARLPNFSSSFFASSVITLQFVQHTPFTRHE